METVRVKKELKNPDFLLLRYYVMVGHYRMTEVLINKGLALLDTNAQLVRLALSNDSEDIVRLLVNSRGYVKFLNTKGKHGFTVLHKAVTCSDVECVKIICDAGLSVFTDFVNIPDDFGNTALFIAEYRKAILAETFLVGMLKGISALSGKDKVITKAERREIEFIERGAIGDADKIKKYLISVGADPTLTNFLKQKAEAWASVQASLVAGQINSAKTLKTGQKVFYWPPIYANVIPPPEKGDFEVGLSS